MLAKTLEVLSWDSILRFGKMHGKSIRDIWGSSAYGKEYIGWLYFNVDRVDFTPEVLEAAGLDRFCFPKPGVKVHRLDKWLRESLYPSLSPAERECLKIRLEADRKRRLRACYSRTCMRDAFDGSKAGLTWANQGHSSLF